MAHLSSRTKLTKVADAATAATSDVNGASLDMAGYEGVLFFTSFGTAAADNTILVEQSSDNNVSDAWAEITGTQVGVSTSDEDVWVDVWRPRERYVRVVAERGTSSTCGDIWAIQYCARSMPVDNTTAGTIHGEEHESPAEGTA